MNTVKSIPSNQPINTNQSGFQCYPDDSGEIIYHWIDTAIEHLSSSKLRQLLHLANIPNIDMDETFIEQVNAELQHRSQLTQQLLKRVETPLH